MNGSMRWTESVGLNADWVTVTTAGLPVTGLPDAPVAVTRIVPERNAPVFAS
jgi:hypothetical protein